MLPVTDGIDISTLGTGAPVERPLEAQLELLLEAFLGSFPHGSTEGVAVQVSYSYAIATGGVPRVQIPIVLAPPTSVFVPGERSRDPAYPSSQESALAGGLATA